MDSNTPLLSVIMPVYNAEKYVKEAINSILTQTYTNFEFIIINDGSTDNSLQLVLEFNDRRIKLFDNEYNKGLVFSLNKAIELAKGQYLARMDADDISMPTRLEEQMKFLVNYPNIDLVGTSAYIINNKGKQIKTWHVKTNLNDLKKVLLFGSPFIHPTIIVKKETLMKIRYNHKFFPAEDMYLWFSLLQQYNCSNLEKKLLSYRYHKTKVSIKHNNQQALKHQLIYRLYLEYLNIPFTEEELLIHSKIAHHSNTLIIKRSELKIIEQWLLKLSRHSLYANNNFLGNKWYSICFSNNFGFTTFIHFIKSPLNQEITYKQKLKLLVISFLAFILGTFFLNQIKKSIKWIITNW